MKLPVAVIQGTAAVCITEFFKDLPRMEQPVFLNNLFLMSKFFMLDFLFRTVLL